MGNAHGNYTHVAHTCVHSSDEALELISYGVYNRILDQLYVYRC